MVKELFIDTVKEFFSPKLAAAGGIASLTAFGAISWQAFPESFRLPKFELPQLRSLLGAGASPNQPAGQSATAGNSWRVVNGLRFVSQSWFENGIIELDCNGRIYPVRLYFVDPARISGDPGLESQSARFINNLLSAKTVSLVTKGELTVSGRAAYFGFVLITATGADLGSLLVESGLATATGRPVDPPASSLDQYASSLAASTELAKEQKRGLFRISLPAL